MPSHKTADLLDMDKSTLIFIIGDLEDEIERHHRDFKNISGEVHAALRMDFGVPALRQVLKRIRGIVG